MAQKIRISFTSYPGRIYSVVKVVESLWLQTMKADDIVLWLSEEEFPNKDKDLPEQLRNMLGQNGFRVEWVSDNLKSHKKYYYALQNNAEWVVITVDDDMYYDKEMVQTLLYSYNKHRNAVSARRARVIVKEEDGLAEYMSWDAEPNEYVDEERMDLCAIGVGGVLYPPGYGNKALFKYDDIKQLAENQDDLWLKFNQILGGIPVVYTMGQEKDIPIENESESCLSIANCVGGANNVCIEKLIEWAKTQNENRLNLWLRDLMKLEQYIQDKKERCCKFIQDLFAKNNDRPIYIFGAGNIAVKMLEFLCDADVIDRIEAILVSNKRNNPDCLNGIKVMQVEELDTNVPIHVILGVGRSYRKEVKDLLGDYNKHYIVFDFYAVLKYYA